MSARDGVRIECADCFQPQSGRSFLPPCHLSTGKKFPEELRVTLGKRRTYRAAPGLDSREVLHLSTVRVRGYLQSRTLVAFR